MTNDKNSISGVTLEKSADKLKIDDNVTISVKFSITGAMRDAFNESNWEKAYNNHDNSIKIKYGVKLHTGGLRKKEVGRPIDTYRKAALFGLVIPNSLRWQKKKCGSKFQRISSRSFPKIRQKRSNSFLISMKKFISMPQSLVLENIR